jgi:hypothetical protein
MLWLYVTVYNKVKRCKEKKFILEDPKLNVFIFNFMEGRPI